MALMKRHQVLTFLSILLIKTATLSGSKSKKNPYDYREYQIHESGWLPSDKQITTHLQKNTPKTFFYWSFFNNQPLSAVIMTCSSTVNWTLFYHGTHKSFSHAENNNTIFLNESTANVSIKRIEAFRGTYVLILVSEDKDAYVHIYVSTEEGGPQALKNDSRNSIKIVQKTKGSLVVKWAPSLVDPQRTDYCLSINKAKHYKTLCEAQSYKFLQPDWDFFNKVAKFHDFHQQIQCVGGKTYATVRISVKKDVTYYFDVFAINKQTNLTYLLDSVTSKKLGNENKFIPLKDGKLTNLKKIEKTTHFTFKVGKNFGPNLHICIIPCGSHVFVQVRQRKKILISQVRVDRFKNLTVGGVEKGQKYVISVFAPLKYDFYSGGVEILATTNASLNSPLPPMPQNTTVKEYDTLRTCSSVTIGWMPSPSVYDLATYCFIIKEGETKETEGYSHHPNRCGLENRLKKSLDFATFAMKYCKTIYHQNRSVITEEIKRLKPGRSYIVLVSVKQHKGKSLSYNLLQVDTLNHCNNKKIY